MRYTEWISGNRDPVAGRHFYALTKPQADQFLEKLVRAVPERMRQLEGFVTERRPAWKPDCTERAFLTLCEVFQESIETVPRTPTEMAAEVESQRRVQPEIFQLLGGKVRNWELSDRTLSLAYDAGICFGQDLLSKESRLRWRVETRRNADFHHPVLAVPRTGQRAPLILGSSINIFLTTAYGIASMNPRRATMSTVYLEWMKYLRTCREENSKDAS